MNISELEERIEAHFASGPAAVGNAEALKDFLALRSALEAGELRSAEPEASAPTGWRVNAWVKRGILLGFRIGAMVEQPASGFSFIDKDTYPARHFGTGDGVRIVPGSLHGGRVEIDPHYFAGTHHARGDGKDP